MMMRAMVVLAVGALALTRAAAAPQSAARILDNLYGTRFANANDGWAVGAFGTIVHTRDGGNSWRPQVSHTTEQLFSVDFADPQHGWIGGRNGLILHTNDGGETWQTQPSGTDRHLFKLAALDAQHAWAVGDWGTMVSTRDGGATWENHSLSRDVILNALSWPDPQHAWVVGEGGAIFTTQDGGATWAEQSSGVEKTLFGVFFADAQQGWAVGLDGLILHTTDGGHSWQVQHGSPEVGALEQVGFAEALGNPSLYDVVVVGKLGYAVGDIGAVMFSDDGGGTWRRRDMPPGWRLQWLGSVTLIAGTHGAFVGANGMAVRIVGDQVTLSEEDGHAAETAH